MATPLPTHEIFGNMRLTGNLQVGSVTLPASSIEDANIAADASIGSDKLNHRHVVTHRQKTGADVATQTEDLYIARAAGTLRTVNVVVTTAPTGSSIGTDKKTVIDIQKGNQSTGFATMLSATITIDQTIAARQVVVGAIAGGGSYAAGDTIRVINTASGSTGTQAQGLVATLNLDEQPS